MLSVVVPCYQARELLHASLTKLTNFLSQRFESWEVVVVDDGSQPEQRPRAEEFPEGARLIQLERNRGKGYAVRTGLLAARGDVRVFTDVDLPYDLAALPHAAAILRRGEVEAVFGDRSMAGSEAHVQLPLLRRLAHVSFTKLISVLVVGGIADSQCGLKAFSGRLVEALAPVLSVDGFAFDVEVYYVLLKHDIPFRRIPVRLVHAEDSSVSPLRHGAGMAQQVLRLPLRHRLGRYDSPALDALREPPYWGGSS